MTKLLYVDLETGGIPVSTGIYEVGLIATENGRIIEELNIGLAINKDRIPEGMGQGYACVSDDEQYINQFKQFVAKYPYPFVAHYASFDRSFLVHYGWVDKNAKFIDTLPLFRKHIPLSEIADHKLGTVMEYYSVQADGVLHTAIADLKGLVECVNKSGILGDFSEASNQVREISPYDIESVVADKFERNPDFRSVINYLQYNRRMEYDKLGVTATGITSKELKGSSYTYKNFEAKFNEDVVSFDVNFTDLEPLKHLMSKELHLEWMAKVDNHLSDILDMDVVLKVPDLPTTSVEYATPYEKMKSTLRLMNVKVPIREFSEGFLEELEVKLNLLDDFSQKIFRQLNLQ